MGFYGSYLHTAEGWAEIEPTQLPPASPAQWLSIHILDSDITAIGYQPHGAGTGVAYLGLTPATYYGNPDESDPVDTQREAEGLAFWAATVTGTSVQAEVIRSFLASDDEELAEDADDVEVFVEIKAARFLVALGLPLPDDLRQAST